MLTFSKYEEHCVKLLHLFPISSGWYEHGIFTCGNGPIGIQDTYKQ